MNPLINIDVARRFTFCTAHRLIGDGAGRCGNVHGRNYTLWVHAKAQKGLDPLGFVIDFGKLRDIIEKWLNYNWDHAYLCHIDDPIADTIIDAGLKLYRMPVNSTMENMAEYLLLKVFPTLMKDESAYIYKLELYETENAKVTVEVHGV